VAEYYTLADLVDLAEHYRSREVHFGEMAGHLEEAVRLIRKDSAKDEDRSGPNVAGFYVGDLIRVTCGAGMGQEGKVIGLDPDDRDVPFKVQLEDGQVLWKDLAWIEHVGFRPGQKLKVVPSGDPDHGNIVTVSRRDRCRAFVEVGDTERRRTFLPHEVEDL
jgi:hypothetical protein